MFNTIPVSTTTTDSYSITIGADVLDQASVFMAERFNHQKVFMVVDEKVHKHHGNVLESKIGASFKRIIKYIVPSGEESKSFEQFSSILDMVLKEGVERSTPIVAIGGGVVGDLVGYVAASALRGVPLIHIPTTLLAMVDSSIGGKTGINHQTGKNLIGAFYQPEAVFADVRLLSTLEKKEWVNGLSEILKYGMIEDPEILETLYALTSGGDFGSPEDWIPVITKSAGIKTDVVSRDVKESGVREFLNFGHTFAHVIEKMGNYKTYSHGEAVFAGMIAALHMSNKVGAKIDPQLLMRFKNLYTFDLKQLGEDTQHFIELMLRDKKVKNSTIRLVLLKQTGAPFVQSFEEAGLIKESWHQVINVFN
tara:strand:+ start:92191 stop:93285 length:1095 start_codon:yes stop_codon:yes gene_type:complete